MPAAGESSSSVELSPPPKSPESPGDAIVLNSSKTVTYPDLSSTPKSAAASSSKSGDVQPGDQPAKAPRKKRGRAATAEAKGEGTEKVAKAARKPRQTRKKAEAALNNTLASTEVAASSAPSNAPSLQQQTQPHAKGGGASRQPKITDLVASAPTPPTATATPTVQSPIPASTQIGSAPEAIPRSSIFKTESSSNSPSLHHLNQSPRLSGQPYDPIRASAFENPRPTSSAATPLQTSPVKAANRASASPSISSLIDPPSTSANPGFSYNASSRVSPSMSYVQPHLSPPNHMLGTHMAKAAPPTSSPKPSTPSLSASKPVAPANAMLGSAMDVDTESVCPPSKTTSRKPSIGTNTSSKAASPKPPRKEKEKNTTTPPLPPLPGSGTLSATLFGAQQSETTTAPTVILEVQLGSEGNKYVNFARLAEQQYGFNALHPRLAAQKERLARVAAAGAALENAAKSNGVSADEMSLDLSEGENDMSNVEMGGTGTGAGSAADGNGPQPRKKRRMKEDMYDKEDPFVDDSELAWEEQQAASKDGFFVYSGPLVPEGESPKVERYVAHFTPFLLINTNISSAPTAPWSNLLARVVVEEDVDAAAVAAQALVVEEQAVARALGAARPRASLASRKPSALRWKPRNRNASAWLLCCRNLPAVETPRVPMPWL